MPNLVIDIGNSFTKIAVFNGDQLVWLQSYTNVDDRLLNDIINKHKPKKAIIASVKGKALEWQQNLSGLIPLISFKADMARSVKNHYQTPQTLGLDRVAAVAGAYALYPGKANLVIDAGTCITYDWIDKNGDYFGGSISPGLNMRYKALNYYTAALPLLQADDSFAGVFGNDTDTAIRSGVQNGVRFEILGFIDSYFKSGQPLNIILTGGDAIFFDTVLKNSIFAPHIKIEPHLVLIGLNAVIQQHND
jgi:type III pantothenate kinase